MGKNKPVYIEAFVFFSLLLLSACTNNSDGAQDNEFKKLLLYPDVKDVNSSILLQLDPFSDNSLKIGESVYLEALNVSSYEIYFPAEDNIQIFWFDRIENRWIQVENSVNYYGNGAIASPKGGEGVQSLVFDVQPVIDNSKEGNIRIVVTGFIVKNQEVTSEPVSAYLDVHLSQ